MIPDVQLVAGGTCDGKNRGVPAKAGRTKDHITWDAGDDDNDSPKKTIDRTEPTAGDGIPLEERGLP